MRDYCGIVASVVVLVVAIGIGVLIGGAIYGGHNPVEGPPAVHVSFNGALDTESSGRRHQSLVAAASTSTSWLLSIANPLSAAAFAFAAAAFAVGLWPLWGTYVTLRAPIDVARAVGYFIFIPAIAVCVALDFYHWTSGALRRVGLNPLSAACRSISRLQFCLPRFVTLLLACSSAIIPPMAVPIASSAGIAASLAAASTNDSAASTPLVISELELPYLGHWQPPDVLLTGVSTTKNLALLNASSLIAASAGGDGAHFSAALDSGCTASATPDSRRIVNKRPCSEVFGDANGRVVRCTEIGDMPVIGITRDGQSAHFSFTNVRVVPSFKWTLLSVNQCWAEQRIDAQFRDDKCLAFPSSAGGVIIPFSKTTQAGELLHRRTHAGVGRIRAAPSNTSDAPKNLTSAPNVSCVHCAAANIRKASHSGALQTPAPERGKLCFDLKGPMTPSIGGAIYAAFWIDEYSRKVFTDTLKSKSEVMPACKRVIAKFNATVGTALDEHGVPEARPRVFELRSDHEGALTSGYFKDFRAEESLHSSMSAPNDHDANGIAESTIRVIDSLATSMKSLCGANASFWPYLFRHAVDVHNATCTTTGSSTADGQLTAEQRFTHRQPSIMDLATFGCRAVVLKPPPKQSKGDLSPRGYVGNYLGRSSTCVGASDVWVNGKVVTSSSVLVDEEYFPWLGKDAAYQPLLPTSGPSSAAAVAAAAQPRPIALGPAPSPPSDATVATVASAADVNAAPRKQLRLLSLFSGPYRRPGGLAQLLLSYGWSEVLQIDDDAVTGGGWADSLRNDSNYTELCGSAEAGMWDGVMIALDCTTYTAARFWDASNGDPAVDRGPMPVRSHSYPDGLPADQLSPRAAKELRIANLIAERAFHIAKLAHSSSSKATIIFENPADRTWRTNAFMADLPEHGSVFSTSSFKKLVAAVGPSSFCTTAMCRHGLAAQKYTTLWYTNDAAGELDKLNGPDGQCNHPHHPRTAGGRAPDGTFNSRGFAAYSDRFNLVVTKAFQAARTGSTMPLGPAPAARKPLSPPAPAPAPSTLEGLPNAAALRLNPRSSLGTNPRASPFVPSPSAASPLAQTSASTLDLVAPSPVAFPDLDSVNYSSYVPYDPAAHFGNGTGGDSPAAPLPVQGRAQRAARQVVLDARPLDPFLEAPDEPVREALLAYFGADAASVMEASVAELVYDTHVEAKPELAPLGPWTDVSDVDEPLWALIAANHRSSLYDADTIVMDAQSALHKLNRMATDSSLPRASYQSLLGQLTQLHVALRADSDGAPSNHTEAVNMGEPWGSAELKEMGNHASNASWSTILREDVPRGRNLHKLVWVYKRKRDGTCKARLCVQGCTLQSGIDYDQTFSCTLRHSSARSIFAFAARTGCRMRSVDYVAAYLQGKFTEGEVVYCYMAPGYEQYGKDGKPLVLRIEKPIYGIPQAGRRLQRQIFPWLKEIGLRQLDDSDNCVWVYDDPSNQEKFVLGVYVDNLQIAHSAILDDDGAAVDSSSFYAKFLKKLTSEWDVVDEGAMEDLLAIQLRVNNDDSFTLHQEGYIVKLLAKFQPNGPPPHVQKNTLPYSANFHENLIHALSIEGSTSLTPAYPDLVRPYQERIGALMYLTTSTRPDIAYPTHQLARAMARPTPELMGEVDHVLAYLSRHRSVGITYDHGGDPKFKGYADASWETRWSTSGWIIMFDGAAVDWGSKKQTSIALSSCEAEIIALSEAAKDMVYFRKLLGGIDKLLVPGPSPLASDNQAARDLSYNPEHHDRTKHVERRHFYIRDMVEKFELVVPWVSTKVNLADFLTKCQMAKRFFQLRALIMNEPRNRTEDPK